MSWELILRGVALSAGLLLVVLTVSAAIRSFVLPRNELVRLNSVLFQAVRLVFDGVAARARTYARRDRVLALYAPVALVALPIFWLALLAAGYTLVFWGLDEGSWSRCYRISASSLLTIGADEPTHGLVASAFSYSEAALGLLLLTLLISYLPSIYQSFARRELVVARLELRAGSPGSAPELLTWLHRTGGLHDDYQQWQRWEEWFVEIEESHTSLPILSFFRSPQPGRSWVTAAGIMLEAAALLASAVDRPANPHAEACFKAGCIGLNRVYRFFLERAHLRPRPWLSALHPAPAAPTQSEFDAMLRYLADRSVPIRPDRVAAWAQYQHLRSRYQPALEFLAELTLAPETRPIDQN